MTLDPNVRQLAQQLLTQRQHDVLELRLAGHSWRTIALALRIDEATARGHHNRALKRIAQHRKDAA